MRSIIVPVVFAFSIAMIFMVCQLFCWFTEPRILLGMGRVFPTMTMTIAWLTLVAYGISRLVIASQRVGSVVSALAASAFVFFVVGMWCSAVFLVVECILLIECVMTRRRWTGVVWWHLGGATSTAISLYVLSLFA
jgi:hypothetical protein